MKLWRWLTSPTVDHLGETRLRIGVARALGWLSRKAAVPPYPIDYLEHVTGHDSAYWVERIQSCIQATWLENPDDPKHPIQVSPARDWIGPIAEEVEEAIIARGVMTGGDENIAGAIVTSLVLATWGMRIAHAKAFDPRRPVATRKEAYDRWFAVASSAFAEAVWSERRDPEYFPQPYESPYLPDATDGDFV